MSSQMIQSKYYELVSYESNLVFFHDLVINSGCKYYAYIVHNNDYDKNGEKIKEHIHLFVEFNSRVLLSKVANLFCVNDNFVEVCRNKNAFLHYLIHDKLSDKVLYNIDDVITNIKNYADIVSGKSDLISIIELSKSIMMQMGRLSFTDYICELARYGYDSYIHQNAYLIKQIHKDLTDLGARP